METEEKGFVVRDRRAFAEEDAPREEENRDTQQEERKAPETQDDNRSHEGAPEQSEEKADKGRESSPPLPEVNFSTLIMSLSSSALFHLGEIPDPQTGQKTKDLPVAKHTIDTIGMLQEKTKGNLNDDEQKFLDSMLTDLRWRFVKASG